MYLLQIANNMTSDSIVMNALAISDGTGINWTAVILAIIGIVTGGAGIKWFNAFQQNKKKQREESNEGSLAFRENLLKRVDEMSIQLASMYEKQLILVEQNAELRTELKIAHDEIIELRAEIKLLKAK